VPLAFMVATVMPMLKLHPYGSRREERQVEQRGGQLANSGRTANVISKAVLGSSHGVGRPLVSPLQKSGLSARGTAASFPEYHRTFSAQTASAQAPRPRP
jgi:hypothetical protein